MSGLWDDLMKVLFQTYRQQLAPWLLREALYQHEYATELKTRTIEADLLWGVRRQGKPMILHIEFQRRRDGNMGKRLWEYNALTTITSGLQVWSIAVYLKKGGRINEPPYPIKLPDGRLVHLFYYENIRLWTIPVEQLRESGLECLLPLWPLSKGGARRNVIEEMIERLQATGKPDLLYMGITTASDMLTRASDKQWIGGIYMKHKDFFANSLVYRMTQEEGREQGHEQGRKEGLEAQHRSVVGVVQARFPELAAFAQKQVATMTDLDLLSRLIIKLSTVQTAQEAEQALIAVERDDKKN